MMASVDHPKFVIMVVYPDKSGPPITVRRPTEETAERARRMLQKEHPKAIVKVRKER